MKPVQPAGLAGFPELGDQYEIVGELGRGGTSVVYRAREKELGRDVAIKVVRSNADGEAVARLAREAKLVAGLRHPNVVPLLGIKHLRDGLALIMQHVPGRTLKQAIRQDGQLAIPFVEHVLREIGSALDYAHKRHGIIHRDIKPENIYLDEEVGRALLSDFGIARSTESESTLTLVGTALGTPAYMSPEQIDGVTLDGRSDLYSLGLVAYEMLTAQQPWAGHNLYTIIYKQKNEELPPITDYRKDVPAYLLRAIDGLLRKDVASRCPDAAHFIAQLPGAPMSAPTFTPVPREPEVVEPPTVSDDSPTLRYQRPAAIASIEVPVDMPPQVDEPPPVVKPVPAEPDPALAAVAAAMAAAGQEVEAEDVREVPVLELPTVRPNWRRSPARTRGGATPTTYALPEITAVTHTADTEVDIAAAPVPKRRSRLVAALTAVLILGASATVVAMINNGDEAPDEMTDAPVSQQRQTSGGALLKSSGPAASLETAGTTQKTTPATAITKRGENPRADSSETPSKLLPVPNVQVPVINPEPVGNGLTAADFAAGASLPAASSRVEVNTDAPAFTPYTVEPELRNRSAVQRALRDNYPRVLRERNVGGSVRLWVLIDTAGRVMRTEVQQSSGNDLLDRAASRVATVMQFTPAMDRNRKTRVWILLPIHFRTEE